MGERRMTNVSVRTNYDGTYTVRVHGGSEFTSVIEALKSRIPPHSRSYSADAKAWRIRSHYHLAKWLEEINWFDDVEVEEYEQARTERQYQRQAPPPQTPPPSPRESALATLHLAPSAPPELIRAAHKALALIHHPDRGGVLELMKAINNAADVLLKAA